MPNYFWIRRVVGVELPQPTELFKYMYNLCVNSQIVPPAVLPGAKLLPDFIKTGFTNRFYKIILIKFHLKSGCDYLLFTAMGSLSISGFNVTHTGEMTAAS